MNSVARNLCFLLWREPLRREDWAITLANRAGCSADRATKLLQHGKLTPTEQQSLAESFRVTESDLQHADLLAESGINIWQENVLCLLSSLQHGSHKMLAEALGVTPGTISKWKKRDHVPERTYKAKLCEVFEWYSSDLEVEPVFLSPTPMDTVGRREWLRARIKQIDSETLHLLFPALERLLS